MLKHRVRRIERGQQTFRTGSQRRDASAQRAALQENRRDPITEDEWLGV
jgi:hypothetical protein